MEDFERKSKKIVVRLALRRHCVCQYVMVAGEIVRHVTSGVGRGMALVALERPLSREVLTWIGPAAIGADLTHLLLRPVIGELDLNWIAVAEVFLRDAVGSRSNRARRNLRPIGEGICFTEAQAREYEESQARLLKWRLGEGQEAEGQAEEVRRTGDSPAWLRLRDLGARTPTFGARREVMRALASNVRSMCDEAALALAVWGDPASVRALHRLFLRGLSREPFAWVILDRARKALLRCVTERDAEWLFDLFFGPISDEHAEHVLALIGRLPLGVQRERIHSESAAPSAARRKRCARALSAIYLREEQRILQRLRFDQDTGVRTLAGELCKQVAGKNSRDHDDPLPRAIVPLVPATLTEEIPLRRPALLQEFERSRESSRRHGDLVQRWRLNEDGLEMLPLNAWDAQFVRHRRFRHRKPSGSWVSGPVSFWLSPGGDRLFLAGVLAGPSWERTLTYRVWREGETVELEREGE
jgi:hypothetical protein